MAKSIQALREERSTLAKALRTHYDSYENKEWDTEAQTKYDGFVKQIDQIDAQIDRQQKLLDIEASKIAATRQIADQEDISDDEAEHRRQLGSEAFAAWMRNGVNGLTDEQRQLLAERHRTMRNDMSTGTGSEGGYTTTSELVPQLIQAMKAFGGLRQVATNIRTATGSQMDWPTTDATSEEGEIVGENAAVAVGETTFGTLAMSTYKYSSKSIAIPFELLQDSEIDLEGYINGLLATRLGRITNRHFTVGTGSGQPRGIITAASVGKTGTTGQTATVVYDDLIDLEHSVDPAYRVNTASFMFHDLTLAEIKKLKDDNLRPLWLPGLAASDPDRILNRPYVINQHMAVMAASAKSIAFGDFSKYIIRDVMAVQLFRMTDSKYTEKGQVGFLAFMRSGGNLIDVGGAVKVYQNAAA